MDSRSIMNTIARRILVDITHIVAFQIVRTHGSMFSNRVMARVRDSLKHKIRNVTRYSFWFDIRRRKRNDTIE